MTTPKLMHFSRAEQIVAGSWAPVQQPSFKPHGLWVSDESEGSYGWSRWCDDEQYGIGPNAFDVTPTDDACLLRLATPSEIVHFHRSFVTDSGLYIDWPRVAAQWQGILITPYQWELRSDHEVSWYYPWDCASGCIWDAAAIASVTRVSAEAVPS